MDQRVPEDHDLPEHATRAPPPAATCGVDATDPSDVRVLQDACLDPEDVSGPSASHDVGGHAHEQLEDVEG